MNIDKKLKNISRLPVPEEISDFYLNPHLDPKYNVLEELATCRYLLRRATHHFALADNQPEKQDWLKYVHEVRVRLAALAPYSSGMRWRVFFILVISIILAGVAAAIILKELMLRGII